MKPGQHSFPPSPPASGGARERAAGRDRERPARAEPAPDLFGDCPRCHATAGRPCVDRAGKARPVPHAARSHPIAPGHRYDDEVEELCAALPDLERRQVHGATLTLRHAIRAAAVDPQGFAGLPQADLTPAAVRAKVAQLYPTTAPYWQAASP